MPELRWILIACGVALLVGIYVWGRRSTKSSASAALDGSQWRPRPEPAVEAEVFEPVVDSSESVLDAADLDLQEEGEALPEEPEPAPLRSQVRPDLDEASEPTLAMPASLNDHNRRYARIEPTFSEEVVTAELPAHEAAPVTTVRSAPAPQPPAEAPTLSMSNAPPPRRIERRKIIALRLATPQRIPGVQLRAALEGEGLVHGKYDVFHRLDEEGGGALFSVASMVEPGTFDLDKMQQESYPGITMFAQLPGPVAGMLAFNELVACSKRLHTALGGTLQDERGVPLTVHRIERIRHEIREFELRPAAEGAHRPATTYSPSP